MSLCEADRSPEWTGLSCIERFFHKTHFIPELTGCLWNIRGPEELNPETDNHVASIRFRVIQSRCRHHEEYRNHVARVEGIISDRTAKFVNCQKRWRIRKVCRSRKGKAVIPWGSWPNVSISPLENYTSLLSKQHPENLSFRSLKICSYSFNKAHIYLLIVSNSMTIGPFHYEPEGESSLMDYKNTCINGWWNDITAVNSFLGYINCEENGVTLRKIVDYGMAWFKCLKRRFL